jgi:hypothetical protein
VRHAFVNQGGPKYPDRDKLKRYKITRLYYEARDPNIGGAFFDELRKIPVEGGIMLSAAWYDGTMKDLADQGDAEVTRLGGNNKQLAVLFDIEYPYQGPNVILQWLTEWRLHRPSRMTLWTPAFHQGGWFTTELVGRINGDPNLVVVPQAYIQDPPIVVDADLTRCDITERYVTRSRVGVFYLPGDVAHRESWDGIVFGFNELP